MNTAAGLAGVSMSSWSGSVKMPTSFAGIAKASIWKKSCQRPPFWIVVRKVDQAPLVAVAKNDVSAPLVPREVAAEETGFKATEFASGLQTRVFAFLQRN